MTDNNFRTKIDPARRLAELKGAAPAEPAAPVGPEELTPDAASPAAFSTLRTDRRSQLMVTFRSVGGNATALAYSYLVGIEYKPGTGGIRMDFSGYEVKLAGRHLAPLFAALAAQRVSVVTEVDDLHAEALHDPTETVVTGIEITPLK